MIQRYWNSHKCHNIKLSWPIMSLAWQVHFKLQMAADHNQFYSPPNNMHDMECVAILFVKLLYPAHCDWNCFWYFWDHNTLWNQPGLCDDTVWKIESEAASFRNTLAHTNVPGRVNSVWLSDSASECEVCHEFAFPWQQVCPVWRRAFNWWHACLECIMP